MDRASEILVKSLFKLSVGHVGIGFLFKLYLCIHHLGTLRIKIKTITSWWGAVVAHRILLKASKFGFCFFKSPCLSSTTSPREDAGSGHCGGDHPPYSSRARPRVPADFPGADRGSRARGGHLPGVAQPPSGKCSQRAAEACREW